jgi:hypothetical protein
VAARAACASVREYNLSGDARIASCETSAMRVTFDPETNMAYISLLDRKGLVGESRQQIPIHEPGTPDP